MGDPKGFIKFKRKEAGYRPIEERIQDYYEVEVLLSDDERKIQASRCMDCGVPFCHWSCPIGNIMPEWQDSIFHGNWEEAYAILNETNNFPEFTGRICPALCEASCVLAKSDEAVTIRHNEWTVAEKAFELGYVKPDTSIVKNGKTIAVIGGGPAGLACCDMLVKMGYTVTLFEAESKVGGFMRYGIPDFKLEKRIIDRRIDIMVQEGLIIKTDTLAGRDISVQELQSNFDAVCITIGARQPRDLNIEGRELKGIHFATEFLFQQNKACSGIPITDDELIRTLNRSVLVIGGGDTGADCVGTSIRQGARKVTQIEILPMPADRRTEADPWPLWPRILRSSSSHKEGCERAWNIQTKKFIGENGKLKKVIASKVEWKKDDKGNFTPVEIPDSEFEIKCDVALLAMGFVHPVHTGLVSDLGLELDPRGNIKTNAKFQTSVEKIFAGGDSRRGASLVVWAIKEGRDVAMNVDEFLRNK